MRYSHTLQIYSDRDFLRSYISDETAANIRSYMNDNDFFDEYDGPLEYLDIDEYTKLYYKNGKVKTAPGEVKVIYQDFDDLEWEDAK